MHVATPLKINGKIIGAFAMSTTILNDFFIPSVKNLALHISYAFEHAKYNLEQKNVQAKISQSEQLYRSMVERAPLGIFTVNTRGVVTSCNEAFIKMAGYSRDELVGKHIAHFPTLLKREAPKYLKMFKSIINGDVPKPFEFNWVNKEGTICSGELFISLIKINNKITGIQAIIKDISDTKKAEVKQKDAEERYNSLFNRSMDLVYLCDFKGRFIDANKAALKLLGYKYGDIKSLSFSSILDSGQLLKAINVIREIRKFGYQKSIQEFKLRRKNGEYIYIESAGSLIFRDGKPYAIQGIARDITERKQSEEKLKEEEKKYRMIFEGVNDEIIYVDKHGRMLDVNNRIRDILGYERDEIIGKKFTELGVFGVRELPKMFKIFKDVISGKALKLMELEAKHKDGHKVPIEVSVKLVKKNGKTEGIMCIVRDTTERKKAEKELEEAHNKLRLLNKELEQKVEKRTAEVKKLLRQKDAFINQLGHDLKSPLSPLVGLLPLLEKTEKDPKSKESIKVLRRSVDRMKNIVFKTLELAELNAPNFVVNLEDINLWEEAENCIKYQQLICDEKGSKVENKIDENIFVKSDRVQLSELFNNLIVNAVKYSPPRANIIIDAHSDGDFATVSIIDSGVGMTKEQLEHIFDEFYKADESRHDFNSSGLGLSICKSIVEKHGGKIWAESSGLGKGSTFYFTMPIGSKISKDYVSEG